MSGSKSHCSRVAIKSAVPRRSGFNQRPTTMTLTAAAPARRTAKAADCAVDPVVQTSSRISTCCDDKQVLPIQPSRRLQPKLVFDDPAQTIELADRLLINGADSLAGSDSPIG